MSSTKIKKLSVIFFVFFVLSNNIFPYRDVPFSLAQKENIEIAVISGATMERKLPDALKYINVNFDYYHFGHLRHLNNMNISKYKILIFEHPTNFLYEWTLEHRDELLNWIKAGGVLIDFSSEVDVAFTLFKLRRTRSVETDVGDWDEQRRYITWIDEESILFNTPNKIRLSYFYSGGWPYLFYLITGGEDYETFKVLARTDGGAVILSRDYGKGKILLNHGIPHENYGVGDNYPLLFLENVLTWAFNSTVTRTNTTLPKAILSGNVLFYGWLPNVEVIEYFFSNGLNVTCIDPSFTLNIEDKIRNGLLSQFDVVFIIRPKESEAKIIESNLDAIEDYVLQGGGLVISLGGQGPGPMPYYEEVRLRNLTERFGMVFERSAAMRYPITWPGTRIALSDTQQVNFNLVNFSDHPVTKNITALRVEYAWPINITDTAVQLAWGDNLVGVPEPAGSALEPVRFGQNVTLLASTEFGSGKVLAYGDPSLFTFQSNYLWENNSQLLLNILSWMINPQNENNVKFQQYEGGHISLFLPNNILNTDVSSLILNLDLIYSSFVELTNIIPNEGKKIRFVFIPDNLFIYAGLATSPIYIKESLSPMHFNSSTIDYYVYAHELAHRFTPQGMYARTQSFREGYADLLAAYALGILGYNDQKDSILSNGQSAFDNFLQFAGPPIDGSLSEQLSLGVLVDLVNKNNWTFFQNLLQNISMRGTGRLCTLINDYKSLFFGFSLAAGEDLSEFYKDLGFPVFSVLNADKILQDARKLEVKLADQAFLLSNFTYLISRAGDYFERGYFVQANQTAYEIKSFLTDNPVQELVEPLTQLRSIQNNAESFGFTQIAQEIDSIILYVEDIANENDIEEALSTLQSSVNSINQSYLNSFLITIDNTTSSNDRCDTGSTQTVFFHASWSNGSDVSSGTIYVNGTGYQVNATGWIGFTASSSMVRKKTWTVTGVNCSGITDYTQDESDPSIIWDRLEVYGGGADLDGVIQDEVSTVWFKARYGFDYAEFNDSVGALYINGSEGTWNQEDRRYEVNASHTTPDIYRYQVSSVLDDAYGLSIFDDQIGIVSLEVFLSETEFLLELKAGWNMVSLPVTPTDASASSVLDGVSFYQLVSWSGTGYATATEFEAGRGYWLLVLEDVNVTVSGPPVSSLNLSLSAGWSMVGGTYDEAQASDVFPGFYQLVTWTGTGYIPATVFEPGKGYWALVLETTEIELPPG